MMPLSASAAPTINAGSFSSVAGKITANSGIVIPSMIKPLPDKKPIPDEVELPILMYHHIDEVGDGAVTISEALFEEHIEYLTSNGWTPISFDELIAYTDGEGSLPEKPIIIVFDDGYESNYSLAFPILSKYNAKATVCVIGVSIGKSTYKDTEQPIIPHFDWEAARELVDSGLVSIQHHTYDMHMSALYETGILRSSALKLQNETDEEYAAALTADYNKLSALIESELGYTPNVFAYPNGQYDDSAEELLHSLGARVTLTTDTGINVVRRGDSGSLYLLKRYTMNQNTDLETLQLYLDGQE